MSTQQWTNIGPDEGALHALLRRVQEHVPVSLIDYLWIFPPRRVAIGESIVLVVAAFDDDPVKRRVITAHFTIARNRKGQASVDARFDEHGSAPANAVSRIVDGVLHRLGEDADNSLREQQIAGDLEHWNALILDLGGTIATSSTTAEPPESTAAPLPAAPAIHDDTAPHDAPSDTGSA